MTPLPFDDMSVAANNCYLARDGAKIDTILLHTMVGTWQSADGRFNNPAAQVSAQWGVTYDGRLKRWVEEQYTAYHAGDWGVNLRSIGIEHEDMGNYDSPRPDLLYSMSAALVAQICKQYNIPCNLNHILPGICGHRDVHATACPDALDIVRIVAQAQAILGGGSTVTFDPFNNPSDLAKLDQRIRDIIMKEPNVTAFALKHYLMAPGPLGLEEPQEERKPDTNMRGTPPAGHPAATGAHKQMVKKEQQDKYHDKAGKEE
jgi:hypothetical protein